MLYELSRMTSPASHVGIGWTAQKPILELRLFSRKRFFIAAAVVRV